VNKNKVGAPLVYLIHIHKTAGTSIRAYLQEGFGKENCFWHGPKRNLPQMIESSPGRFNRLKAIGGHIGFAKIPKPVLDKYPIFVSALRDPLARVVSHYHHIRTHSTHNLHPQVGNKTLFEAMRVPVFATMSDRLQIGYLCGRKDLSALRDALSRNKYIIGKQEKLEDLFRCLSTTFGFPILQDVRVNVADKQSYEDDIKGQHDYADAVELIRRLNGAEYEFYNSFEAVWSNVSIVGRELASAPSTLPVR
jgi:hypothetical protein